MERGARPELRAKVVEAARADVELGTYDIDVSELERALSPRTRAVMIAHTLGNPFAVREVRDFCKQHDLWLVEDCCDAVGAS